jgi:DNA repair protein RadC
MRGDAEKDKEKMTKNGDFFFPSPRPARYHGPMTRPAPSPYRIASGALFLDGGAQTYPLIHDLPSEERPREKLREHGPGALTTPELLAVIFGTGSVKESVLQMAHRVMKEYGEKSIMRETDAMRLARELGLPVGKAMQIVACGELGRRFFAKNEIAAPTIRTASEVYEHVIDMRALPKEHLRGLYLNAHYKVIRDEVISIGTIDANMVHPREVFRPALEYAAAALILVHNHPSGVLEASEADVAVTKQLIAAGRLLGITLVDHVIVSKDGFASVPARYQS